MKKLITIPLILFSLLGFSQKQIDSTVEKTIIPSYISGISNDITSRLDTFVNKWKRQTICLWWFIFKRN